MSDFVHEHVAELLKVLSRIAPKPQLVGGDYDLTNRRNEGVGQCRAGIERMAADADIASNIEFSTGGTDGRVIGSKCVARIVRFVLIFEAGKFIPPLERTFN